LRVIILLPQNRAFEESGRDRKNMSASRCRADPSRIIRGSLYRSEVIPHHLQVPS
jgi:hypothetical protein